MKRKISSCLMIVIIINMTVLLMSIVPLMTVNATSTINWDLTTTTYANIAALQSDGWVFGNSSLCSISASGLQVGNSTTGTTGYKTFTPIVIRGSGVCPLGANAKTTFIIKKVNLNGTTKIPFISLQGTDAVNGTNNVVAVCRTGSTSFYYGTTGSTAQSGVSGSGTSLAASGANNYKFEISISDANGNYLSKPIVAVYVSSSGTGPYTLSSVSNGDVLSNVTQIDTVCFTSITATSAKAVSTGASLDIVADPVITVSINDNEGMLINRDTGIAVKNGNSIILNGSTTSNLKVVSFGGKQINSVVYDGNTIIGSGQFNNSFTINAFGNKNIVITFSNYSPPNPEVKTYDKVFQSVESSAPVSVSYGTVHGSGYTSYGILVWSTADADLTLADILANPGNGKYIFTAATGRGSNQAAGKNSLGQFGVGLRSLPTGNYKMKTYVSYGTGQVSYGDIVTFTVS